VLHRLNKHRDYSGNELKSEPDGGKDNRNGTNRMNSVYTVLS
jgi:hypothetical protein